MIVNLLAFSILALKCGVQAGHHIRKNICAISMVVDSDRKMDCFEDLVKALENAKLFVAGGASLGWAFVTTTCVGAKEAVQIARRLSKEEHFEFDDLTDSAVARRLEPLTGSPDPSEFRSRVRNLLFKFDGDTPLPILVATVGFEINGWRGQGEEAYVPLHQVEGLLQSMPYKTIKNDLSDLAPAGEPRLIHIHSSIYCPAESAYAGLRYLLDARHYLPSHTELANLQTTKSASQDAVLYDANLDFAKRGLSKAVLIATVDNPADAVVAEVTTALGTSPFYWYKDDTSGDAPAGWPDSDLAHASLFIPKSDLAADLGKIRAVLGQNRKGAKLINAASDKR